MTKDDLINWHKDWENKQISSDAYVLFLTAYIEDSAVELKAKNEELDRLRARVVLMSKEDKVTFKDYKFTNCNDCIHKADNKFSEICFSCKRYYGCYFEREQK